MNSKAGIFRNKDGRFPFVRRYRRGLAVPPFWLALATEELGLEATHGCVYGHTNGPRFETGAEIRHLVTAVSQTCGPEAVPAAELRLPYGLAGLPVNYATGVSERESREDLGRLLARSSEVPPRVVLRTVEMFEEEDLACDYMYVYRVEGGVV